MVAGTVAVTWTGQMVRVGGRCLTGGGGKALLGGVELIVHFVDLLGCGHHRPYSGASPEYTWKIVLG